LRIMRQLHVFDELGEDNMHNNKGEAIAAAVKAADDDICRGCELRIFMECATKPGPGKKPPRG